MDNSCAVIFSDSYFSFQDRTTGKTIAVVKG